MTKFYVRASNEDDYEEVEEKVYFWCAAFAGVVDFAGGDFNTNVYEGKMVAENA